jgi:hypothetical protein
MVSPSAVLVEMRRDGDAGPFGMLRRQMACLAGVSDGCAGVDRCLGTGPPFGLSPCPMRCESFGLACDRNRCRRPPGPSCNEPYAPRCDAEGRVVACRNGALEVGPRCGDHGLVCEADPSRRPEGVPAEVYCRGRGPGCFASSWHGGEIELLRRDAVGCAGDALQLCVNGRVHDLDCGKVIAGSRCARVEHEEGGPTYACALAAECTPPHRAKRAPPDRCDGSSVVLCNAGRVERVSCGGAGLGACRDGACGR